LLPTRYRPYALPRGDLGDGNRVASELSREQLRCEALGEHHCEYGRE